MDITPEQNITPEKKRTVHRAFRQTIEAALDSATLSSRVGQLELFPSEDELYLSREVERMLWRRKLPNAGDLERKWLKWLRLFSRDESLVVNLKIAAGTYAKALEACLPHQEKMRLNGKMVWLPGCYYTRRPVTSKTDKALFEAAYNLLQEAKASKSRMKRWLAEFILGGKPVAVSNFMMETLYLLRKSDGTVTRLVRFMNTKGEVSKGDEKSNVLENAGGAMPLPNNMWAGSEKFRELVGTYGNFAWGGDGGAGNTELQMLQWDVTEEAAYREVALVESCGWYPLPKRGKKVVPGKEVQRGIWFFRNCAIAPGGVLLRPDEDGVYWFEDAGYVLNKQGRETAFVQGVPDLQPDLAIGDVEFDTCDWEEPKSDSQTTPTSGDLHAAGNQLGGFYREICRRFYDTAGGYAGWMTVGAMLSYAALPEIFEREGNFSGQWVHGAFQSGKTTYVSWGMALTGFIKLNAGLGLISSGVTPVGLMCQLENYSCVPLWLDEYRQKEMGLDHKAKEPILRDCYSRQNQAKWSADGKQREYRTMVVVSGESTANDGATRSRYPHVLIAEQQRIANHFEWMQNHRAYFPLVFRELLLRREEFVPLLLQRMSEWMTDPALGRLAQRNKLVHAGAWAAFVAAGELLGSHTAADYAAFKKWLCAHAAGSARDVESDTNVNVFMQDFITAFNAGAIPMECLRVEKIPWHDIADIPALAALYPGAGNADVPPHAPGKPNQLYWEPYIVYIEPHLGISSVNIYLRKENTTLALKLKDLRDQMSRHSSWEQAGKERDYRIMKRFPCSQSSKPAWGIYADLHPLGYQAVSDERYETALKTPGDRDPNLIGPQFADGDPRKGPLFDIIHGWLKWDRDRRNTDKDK